MIDIYQSSFINFKCSEIANCENQMGEGKKGSPITLKKFFPQLNIKNYFNNLFCS